MTETIMMLMTLHEAALRIRPDGLISPRSLRAEISAGRLSACRIAGRLMVSEDDIADYLARARLHGSAPATIAATRPKPQKPAFGNMVRPAAPIDHKPISAPLAAAAAALVKRGGTGKRAG